MTSYKELKREILKLKASINILKAEMENQKKGTQETKSMLQSMEAKDANKDNKE